MKLKVSYIQLPTVESARRASDLLEIVRTALMRQRAADLKNDLVDDIYQYADLDCNRKEVKNHESQESISY